MNITRLISINPGQKCNLCRISGIPKGTKVNICFFYANKEQGYLESIYNNQDFLVPEFESASKILISGGLNNDMIELYNNNVIYPIHENKDIDTEGVRILDLSAPAKDVDVNVQQEGLIQYHYLKERILIDALNFTTAGFVMFMLTGNIDLGFAFLIGGGLNQVYQLMLYDEIDKIGKEDQWTASSFIMRICVLMGTLLAIATNVPELSKERIIIMTIACFLGFLTGKIALIKNMSKY